jgi:hypothetical protein
MTNNNRRIAILLAMSCVACLGLRAFGAENAKDFDPTEYVNVFHPGGHVFHGANVPFGMVFAEVERDVRSGVGLAHRQVAGR